MRASAGYMKTQHEESADAGIKYSPAKDHSGIGIIDGTNVDHDFPKHIHHSYSLGLVTKGQRIIQTDNETEVLSANQCFIINPLQPHSCRRMGGKNHDYSVISIYLPIMQKVSREIWNKEEIPFFPKVKIIDPLITDRFSSYLYNRNNHDSNRQEKLFSLLERLICDYAVAASPGKSVTEIHPVIQQICCYIDRNLDQIIRLDDLADQAHVSPFYLNRLFREEIGIPPYTYLLQNRVKKSMEVLLETRSIIDTSSQMGFSDQSHFSRFFKEFIGVTPGRFLNQNQGGTEEFSSVSPLF
ncbi:hypothetical protein ADM99_04225 [Leptolinea tardivitalis]|uniref:HTH araC/xylS-type domain-containing protein n=2 Tax=Leptolinea tardivitalis TaxID=229920 RepID=A0A0P6XVM7_9CHLR|nr:hypothetical protein ADM99_04225 [Leptolinea tardivitalis]